MKIRFMNHRFTFALLIEIYGKRFMPILQLSTKNPWLIPKVDLDWCNRAVLFGWLFLYIGWNKNPWDYDFK